MITPNWTPLIRTIPIYDPKKIRFVLTAQGILTLNLAAFHALRSPLAVHLFYDERQGLIGIAAAEPGSPNAIPARKRSNNGHHRKVSLIHFCTRFRIALPKTTLIFPDPTFGPDGVLILNHRQALADALREAAEV